MIRVQIADDHAMFRQGIVSLLHEVEGFNVTGQATNGKECLEMLQLDPPDILLLDIEMPEMDGFITLKLIRQRKIKTKVLVLTMHKSAGYIKNIVKAGASGYLVKDASTETLVSAIKQIIEKGTYFSPETTATLIESLQSNSNTSPISPREKEVVALIAEGNTTKEIAKKLFLSKHTIESHRQNILLKLGLKNSAELISYAIRKGWA